MEGGGGAYPLKAVGFALSEAFRKAVDSPGLRGPEQSERPSEPRASGQPTMGSTPCAPDAMQLALACIRAKTK